MTAQTDMGASVAEIILDQLGGNRFIAMTGASGFVSGPGRLTFRLPATITRRKATMMRVVLDGNDTYRLELLKLKKLDCVLIEQRANVYAEQLQTVFTAMTGLRTNLG